MTLNSSGQISLGGSTSGQSVNLELGRSATASINMDETEVRYLANKTSGEIEMDDFYGKTGQVSIDYLIIAGGGGGSDGIGAGGGAGGYREDSKTLNVGSYSVVVGAGGGRNSNGQNSSFSGVTATGGGRGGRFSTNGGNGGSGVVIIRYLTSSGINATGGTKTTSGSYTIHTFNTSGTFQVFGGT